MQAPWFRAAGGVGPQEIGGARNEERLALHPAAVVEAPCRMTEPKRP
ncbi:hypothetical protein [Streptomyces sp. NPDC086777]